MENPANTRHAHVTVMRPMPAGSKLNHNMMVETQEEEEEEEEEEEDG